MRLKLVILILYALALAAPAVLLAQPVAQGGPSGDDRFIVKLDQRGERGVVQFDHKKHEPAINPDPKAVFKAKKEASCSGCHHTTSKATGIPQLIKCALCHRSSGNPMNPKNNDSEEIWSKTAFHSLCVACHQASNKGPIKCGDCHK